MSNKIETLAKIQKVGIVAVVRATSIEQAEKITDACIAGGVAAIELTFTVPHADKLIEAMRAKYSSGEIIIGAGTVMDAATARIAILAGAEYIVSPYFDPETVKPVTVTVLRQCRVFTPLPKLFTLWNAVQMCLKYSLVILRHLLSLKIFTALFLMLL